MSVWILAHPWLSFIGFIATWALTCELISEIIVNVCKTIIEINQKESK